jgi:transmembrane sensor
MVSDRQAVEQRAVVWLQKRDAGSWSEHDQAELDAWLDSDANHRVAYLRLEAAWEQMNRLQALGAGYSRGYVPTAEELEASSWRALIDRSGSCTRKRTYTRWLAVAASFLVAITVGIGAYFSIDYFRGERYSTPIGGVATVPLKDGTNITLSTDSSIRVQLKDRERHIDVTQGEAFFDVAHDPSRPFIVQAGSKRITAVGTQFSVRRDRKDVRVVVTEGKVKFEDGEGPAPHRVEALLLTAGSIARASDAGVRVQSVALPQAEEQLSWRTGYVVFHATPLADAVAEFNRYNDRKIVIDDPAIAAMQLTGQFRSTNIDSFVRLLEQTFGIRVQQTEDRIVLSERHQIS